MIFRFVSPNPRAMSNEAHEWHYVRDLINSELVVSWLPILWMAAAGRGESGLAFSTASMARQSSSQTLRWWRIAVRHSKWRTRRINSSLFWRTFDEFPKQNSSKFVRIRQNSSEFVKIRQRSSKFRQISSRFRQHSSTYLSWNRSLQWWIANIAEKQIRSCAKVEFRMVQRNVPRVDLENCWNLRQLSLS